MERFEPERDVPPGALSSSTKTKFVNPDFCSRHAAVRPATPPPTITTDTLVHASSGTSTWRPSRKRCPKKSDAPTISPAGSGAVSLRRHAASANGTPKNAARISRLFMKEILATKKHKRHKTMSRKYFVLFVPFCGPIQSASIHPRSIEPAPDYQDG